MYNERSEGSPAKSTWPLAYLSLQKYNNVSVQTTWHEHYFPWPVLFLLQRDDSLDVFMNGISSPCPTFIMIRWAKKTYLGENSLTGTFFQQLGKHLKNGGSSREESVMSLTFRIRVAIKIISGGCFASLTRIRQRHDLASEVKKYKPRKWTKIIVQLQWTSQRRLRRRTWCWTRRNMTPTS